MPARHPRLLYAHRGAAVELPENTLPAFRRAAEIGVDAIETDVHLTADGHVLVSHDPSALRMTGVGVAWRDLTLDQARALDVGWGFVDRAGQRPHLGRGIRVCTLEEALRELPHLRFNVDLKVHTPSPVPTVLALLRRLGAEERVTLASFLGVLLARHGRRRHHLHRRRERAPSAGPGEPIGSLTQMGTIRLGKRTENRSPLIKDFVPLAEPRRHRLRRLGHLPRRRLRGGARTPACSSKSTRADQGPSCETIKPMPAVFDQATSSAQRPNVKTGLEQAGLAEQLIAPTSALQGGNGCDRLVMVWCGSTPRSS
jgi:hypothetical protein